MIMVQILMRIISQPDPAISFIGQSPLMWVQREFNVQADFLCHCTLDFKRSWQEVSIPPEDFLFQPGDFLAAWSDGGCDDIRGGTAAYIIKA